MTAQNFTFCTARATFPRCCPAARSPSAMSAVSKREKPPVDWELVYKRNPVERIKRDKSAARDPRRAAGADRRRLRARSPRRTSSASSGGASTTTSRRSARSCSGQAARRASSRRRSCARSARSRTGSAAATASSSTRQNIQLHWLELARAAGRVRPPRRGRARRPRAAAATPSATSPAARSQGLDPDELFDCSADRRRGGRVLLRQPRLLRTCRASTRSRSPPAPTAATRPRSTASR